MDAPSRDVPSQVPEGHVLTHRSVVTFELSAAVAPEYPGQILRTVFLGEPTDEYLTLHEVASPGACTDACASEGGCCRAGTRGCCRVR